MKTGRSLVLAVISLSVALAAYGQPPAASGADSSESIRGQVQELRTVLEELRLQLAASRAETDALRGEVRSLRQQIQPQAMASAPAPASENPVAHLADEQRLIAAKVDDQFQTKVSSGSKYQVRLSGIALLNGFTTRGSVDNLDLPETAQPVAPGESRGSTGATVRQSALSLEVFGPQWGGVKASGELKVDFFGGFPATAEGVTAGLLRLRSARLNLDWKNTSLVAGQDTVFFSPLSPTSLVSAAYPALSASGNLWTWTPQIYVERRVPVSENSRLSIQGGVLDALTGELPLTEYDRSPTAGEHSRFPAYAMRLGWQKTVSEFNAGLGLGSFYSRQDWGFGRSVDAWAFTADWDLPIGRWLALSGEFYRGRGLGGLGGGATGSVVFSGPEALAGTVVVPVESLGGWSQLKFKPAEKLQFNSAFGKDGSFGERLDHSSSAFGLVRRNASGFVNVIYQPRTNLLFSIEYRRLWTSRYWQTIQTADHFGLGVGILF